MVQAVSNVCVAYVNPGRALEGSPGARPCSVPCPGSSDRPAWVSHIDEGLFLPGAPSEQNRASPPSGTPGTQIARKNSSIMGLPRSVEFAQNVHRPHRPISRGLAQRLHPWEVAAHLDLLSSNVSPVWRPKPRPGHKFLKCVSRSCPRHSARRHSQRNLSNTVPRGYLPSRLGPMSPQIVGNARRYHAPLFVHDGPAILSPAAIFAVFHAHEDLGHLHHAGGSFIAWAAHFGVALSRSACSRRWPDFRPVLLLPAFRSRPGPFFHFARPTPATQEGTRERP